MVRGSRIHGPYRYRSRWRLVLVVEEGSRRDLTFATEAEAAEYKAEALRQLEGRTVSEAIAAYLADKRRRGRKDGKPIRESTITTLRFRLDAIHGAAVKLDELTGRRCQSLYDTRTRCTHADTHRNELTAAKAFGAWCVKQGWLPRGGNPWAGVEPIGGRQRGKEQLRFDEARTLRDVALARAKDGDVAAVAVLCALLLGMRSEEITSRIVRDVDDDGRLLWVPWSKTDAGRRVLEVPADLQPLLRALTVDQAPAAPLFRPARVPKSWRDWLGYHVERLCLAAGVPVVCPHSLRGSHATIATEFGQTAHAVAAALGHASPTVTQAHYTRPEATERAARRRALKVLAGGRR